jgi:carboxymethylenebutenolidase
MIEDFNSLFPETKLNRRGFMATSLATGFALAVQPINAQDVITTDTKGIVAGEVKIPTSLGEIPAYHAMPATGKNFPVVLVVQEIFGVHEHIKDVCRRFAKAGHLAIAPEMYARQGDVSKLQMRDIMPVVAKVPDAQVMSDLDAAVAWAGKNKGNTAKLGITGFCWGGRIVWLYAAHNPKVKAGVAWYGRLVGGQQPAPLQPKHPIDVGATLKVPVLGLYAGKDSGIPLDSIDKMKAELAKGKSKSEFVIYPEAAHGFHADYRASYKKDDAQDGWKRLQAWFKKNGAA